MSNPVDQTNHHREEPTQKPSVAPSSPIKAIPIPYRTSSLAASLPPRVSASSIPQRTSSKRKTSSQWDTKFTDLSTEELDLRINDIGAKLKEARKNLKRKISMDDEYWDRYLEISQLHQDHAQMESQIGLRKFQETPGQSWYDQPDAQSLKLQHDSWSQWDSIMKKHVKRIQNRVASGRETFVRLFTTSKVGLDLPAGVGRRDSSLQSNFVASMTKAYCPDPPAIGYRWEPVLQKWMDDDCVHAAHLFPYRQSPCMDEIFGKGASEELFAPENGLFLHKHIENALNKGLLAIVPDLDLDPADPQFPLNDQQERQNRVKEWENWPVKDYKIVIIDKDNNRVKNTKLFIVEDLGFQTLGELDGRKLVFKTNFRPRARYIWWTYLNTILRTAWNQQGKDGNVQHHEVRKATRYWGTRGRYVMQNQLLGFVEEIGHDVDSILEQGDDNEDTQEPGLEAVVAIVQEAMVSSLQHDKKEGEDSDEDEDSDENEDGDE